MGGVWVDVEFPIIRVMGRTYPVKEDLKKLGFHWNGSMRAWERKVEDLKQLMSLIDSVSKVANVEAKSKWNAIRSFVSGKKAMVGLVEGIEEPPKDAFKLILKQLSVVNDDTSDEEYEKLYEEWRELA